MGQPARLEKLSYSAITKLCSDGTTLSLSQKRPATLRHSNLDELRHPKEKILTSAKYIKEDLQTMTKFCMDLFLQAEASCRPLRRPQKSEKTTLIHTVGATGFNRTPLATLFFRDRISFRWRQHKR